MPGGLCAKTRSKFGGRRLYRRERGFGIRLEGSATHQLTGSYLSSNMLALLKAFSQPRSTATHLVGDAKGR